MDAAEATTQELLARIAQLEGQLAARPPPVQAQVQPPGQPYKPPPAQPPVNTVALQRALQRRRGEATPDEILEQILALKSVITSGVNSAGYGDKRTEFRSLNELRQILADLEEDLDDALGTGGQVRQIRMTTQADKGL
jgi:hypothetical protein